MRTLSRKFRMRVKQCADLVQERPAPAETLPRPHPTRPAIVGITATSAIDTGRCQRYIRPGGW